MVPNGGILKTDYCGKVTDKLRQGKFSELGDYPVIALTWEDAMRGAPWDYVAKCEEAVTAYENDGELSHRWPNLSVSPEEKDEFDYDYRNSETRQEPSTLESEDPIPTTFADPETVQCKLVRAKAHPTKLKDMSSPPKCIH
jgi:hypothetical protein